MSSADLPPEGRTWERRGGITYVAQCGYCGRDQYMPALSQGAARRTAITVYGWIQARPYGLLCPQCAETYRRKTP